MSYPNSGRLSANKYKQHEKQPDLKGSITLERALLKQLMAESEDEVTIRLSGWNRSGQYGEFISLMYDSYKKQEEPAPRQDATPQDDGDVPF